MDGEDKRRKEWRNYGETKLMNSGLCHTDLCVSLQELFRDIYLVFFDFFFFF